MKSTRTDANITMFAPMCSAADNTVACATTWFSKNTQNLRARQVDTLAEDRRSLGRRHGAETRERQHQGAHIKAGRDAGGESMARLRYKQSQKQSLLRTMHAAIICSLGDRCLPARPVCN